MIRELNHYPQKGGILKKKGSPKRIASIILIPGIIVFILTYILLKNWELPAVFGIGTSGGILLISYKEVKYWMNFWLELRGQNIEKLKLKLRKKELKNEILHEGNFKVLNFNVEDMYEGNKTFGPDYIISFNLKNKNKITITDCKTTIKIDDSNRKQIYPNQFQDNKIIDIGKLSSNSSYPVNESVGSVLWQAGKYFIHIHAECKEFKLYTKTIMKKISQSDEKKPKKTLLTKHYGPN